MHDLAHIVWVGSVLCRSLAASPNGRLEDLDDLDRDLSDLSVRRVKKIGQLATLSYGTIDLYYRSPKIKQ